MASIPGPEEAIRKVSGSLAVRVAVFNHPAHEFLGIGVLELGIRQTELWMFTLDGVMSLRGRSSVGTPRAEPHQ